MIKEGKVEVTTFETKSQKPKLTKDELIQTLISNIEEYYKKFDTNEIRIKKDGDLFSLNITHYHFSTS